MLSYHNARISHLLGNFYQTRPAKKVSSDFEWHVSPTSLRYSMHFHIAEHSEDGECGDDGVTTVSKALQLYCHRN